MIETIIDSRIEAHIESTIQFTSLYIHIPFCKKKCNYCDFLSFDHEEDKIEAYINALVEEIRSYKTVLKKDIIKSIFIGGGTPSVLEPTYIDIIMKEIHKLFKIDKAAEITIECNPGSLSRQKVMTYKELGINRISLGLQTVNDERLQHLGRIHTFKEFVQNYNMLREVGYDNINVDLIFGLPNQTIEEWQVTIDQIITLNPEHISVYGLIIEEDTKYYKQFQQKLWTLPEEEEERDMYWYASQTLSEHGYNHYEISNYSKQDYSCKHNKVYWTLGNYIGMGLGAASYYENNRMDNIRNIQDYIAAQGNLDQVIANKYESSLKAQKEEFLFLGLRLFEGISKQIYYKKFNEKLEDLYGEVIDELLKQELLVEEGDRLRLTNRGMDISNYVLAHFIL
ncbi:MAG: coproporphyrinogen III oxidase [Firmicutes bacterium HGW-Firmicutes-7]|nr:MAG: coproporphyrinogen III oxidase [Firmicutes bacterium HGW-Firmicutes-7]